MIKPDWDVFKAKFSENPQQNFEWFCYLLFCREFKKPYGIFRYKNQTAIETDPVVVGNDKIGWQAKFYESSLSNHKNELLNIIEKSKKYYSDITKLIFYTNQEWGQNRGKMSKGLEEIDKKAKELNIILEWRTASYFESDFVSNKNSDISKHFFSFQKSIFDLIEKQVNHNENLLYEIKTSINFNNNNFEINRDTQLQQLKDQSQKFITISGVAGIGKTVLVKKLYESLKDKVPCFIFKATEFELRNIDELFDDFSFRDFVGAFQNVENKIVIIDSAERLLDLKNTDPFKEFLTALIKYRWKIIFTTRSNYLEQLNYQFFEIYNIAPLNINLNNLDLDELNDISDKYKFSLPKDKKLLELVRNPFYLNEYLKYYNSKNELDYIHFKDELWSKNIKKSKPERERCFLQIAEERANKGQFFITPNCDSSILDELTKDGILGYEEAGYFITHDIYEEWALEKSIGKQFTLKANNEEFFNKIGHSFPIRRSFRNWLSEKLLLEDVDIKKFIEDVFDDKKIEPFWKDEIFVSVLLSDYSEVFFDLFEEELLSNYQELLERLTFLLRIACKDINENFFEQLGIKKLNLIELKYVLTKPKGQGWKTLIEFVYRNIERIGVKQINFILPIIYDWNSNFPKGETTRYSSLIALQYYEWIINKDIYFTNDSRKEQIINTILYGAFEIKNELKNIFEKILQNKWKYPRDPYYDFLHTILTKRDGIFVWKVLPEYVLNLADLLWTYTPKPEYPFGSSSFGIGSYFGLEELFDYFPSSAFQTPIYWLLQFSYKKTVDFILHFVNESIKKYAKSGYDSSVKKVEVYINEKDKIKQYISHCVWNMYRGTSSPVSPYLLQSVHMALEKYLLEEGKEIDSESLENKLLYIIKNSESASITSIVASIVLAYPEKTFNIAKILFKTKEFILQDTIRWASEEETEFLYSIGYGLNNQHKIFQDERIKTCGDKHRQMALEHLFLYYQVFKNEETSKVEAYKRQKILWEILDNYYAELPNKPNETESDKKWKLFLARMDKRKMNVTTKTTESGVEIHFDPEIEPKLKEYSEKSWAKNFEPMKYSSLELWANYKMKGDERYKKYRKYEDKPKQALKEVKEITEELKTTEFDNCILFNHSVPVKVCSVLMKHHAKDLSKKEKEFCKGIIIEAASSSFRPNYQYQISDGVECAISVLPVLFKELIEERKKIKKILLITLFDINNIGRYAEFSDFSANAVKELFEISPDDAQALMFGYLYLKPKYEALREAIRQEYYKRNIYQLKESDLIRAFLDKYQADLQKVLDNKLIYEDSCDIGNLDLHGLKKVFQLIPLITDNEVHKRIIKDITSAFSQIVFSDDKEIEIDYKSKHDFLQIYANFVLNLPEDEIPIFLKPFIDNFKASETIAELFQEFIIAEDKLNTYNKFWLVWKLFKPKVISVCKKDNNAWDVDNIIKSYLFAQTPWAGIAKEWHSLRDCNKRFFKEISDKLGHCSSTLYAISKLLNSIGSFYLSDGVIWIADIINNNKKYIDEKLDANTIYYIENLTKNFIFKNREEIKRKKELKGRLMIILNFIIEKGSSVGYMLRENTI